MDRDLGLNSILLGRRIFFSTILIVKELLFIFNIHIFHLFGNLNSQRFGRNRIKECVDSVAHTRNLMNLQQRFTSVHITKYGENIYHVITGGVGFNSRTNMMVN